MSDTDFDLMEDLALEEPDQLNEIFLRSMIHTSDQETPKTSEEETTNDSPKRPPEYLKICVTNPQRVEDCSSSHVLPGANSYITYLITTYTNIPEYEGTQFILRRRFKEVVALADKLAQVYKGYFIPLRPDKRIVKGPVVNSHAFIEQRREDLEKYFARLAAHPVLRKSEELRMFLRSLGKLPFEVSPDMASIMMDGASKLFKDVAQENQTSSGKLAKKAFKGLKKYVVSDSKASLEEDPAFLLRKNKHHTREQVLQNVSHKADALVKALTKVGAVTGDLGTSIRRLGQLDHSNSAMLTMGQACLKDNVWRQEEIIQTKTHLDTIPEHLSLMQAMNGAFDERSKALSAVQAHKSALANMEHKANKLKATSTWTLTEFKKEEIRAQIQSAEQGLVASKAEYESIKKHNSEDAELYEAKVQEDFSQMLLGFVQSQVAQAEKSAHVWNQLLDQWKVDG